MKKLFTDMFREYGSIAQHVGYETNVIGLRLVGASLGMVVMMVIGFLMLVTAYKIPPSVYNRSMFYRVGGLLFLEGVSKGLDAWAIWHNYYMLRGWLGLAIGILGIAILYHLPSTVKRLKQMNDYDVLLKQAQAANDRAATAEAKADRLMDMMSKQNLEGDK